MLNRTRHWGSLFAIVGLTAASAVWGGPVPVAPKAKPGDASSQQSDLPKSAEESTAPDRREIPQRERGPAYTFRFSLKPGKDLFYVIENQFRDSGGVPPLLAYSTWAKDKKTIVQQVLPASVRQPTSASAMQPAGAYVTWRCDRYEASEQGHKDKVTYDSIRDSYPPPSLMDLGGIAGSKATFILDPSTGRATDINLILTTNQGESTRRNLSKTAEKCAWNQKTLAQLLDDLGPYYWPKGPVHVGDTWSRSYSEAMRTFGTVTTQLRCTLRSVRVVEGREVATIEIAGDVTLVPESKPAPATSRPTTASAPTANKPKDFRIDRAACNGSVEFDLTRGELVQLSLRRDLSFVADVSTPNSDPMQLKSGTEHILRVKTSQTAPPRPIIVGGPKPPYVPPEQLERPGRVQGRPMGPRGHPITTRPASPRSTSGISPVPPARTATRPSGTAPGVVNPRTPTSRPTRWPRPAATQPTGSRSPTS